MESSSKTLYRLTASWIHRLFMNCSASVSHEKASIPAWVRWVARVPQTLPPNNQVHKFCSVWLINNAYLRDLAIEPARILPAAKCTSRHPNKKKRAQKLENRQRISCATVDETRRWNRRWMYSLLRSLTTLQSLSASNLIFKYNLDTTKYCIRSAICTQFFQIQLWLAKRRNKNSSLECFRCFCVGF